jgi:3-oxoacyl-[acyl-carrier protein] reductase
MKIFLTGGSGGIGKAIKQVLEAENIEVIAPTSKDLDLSKNLQNIDYPTVDGFIHCAGVNNVANIDNISTTDLLDIYKINTVSFIELCKHLKINNNSNIIAIGSLYSTGTKEGRLQYSMSKHALFGAVKTLALEKSHSKIKVNLISPGFVNTPMTIKNNTLERINFLEENIPLGLTQTWEIGNLCLYLIKHNNTLTGQNLIVDGGYSLKGI